jgi:hypothetical protein
VAASLHQLAGVLKEQGDLPGARARLERALEIKALVFGTEEHASVSVSLHSLASVLQAQGDLPAARARLERVIEIERKVYGSRDHYSTAITELQLASLLLTPGMLSEETAPRAIELIIYARDVFLQQLGPDHRLTKVAIDFLKQVRESASERPQDPLSPTSAGAPKIP